MRRLALLIVLAGTAAAAQTSRQLGYHGLLSRVDGGTVSGAVTMTFALFPTSSGGTAVWSETRPITLDRGGYSTLLGEVVALPTNIFDGRSLFLELSVQESGAPAPTVLSPRQPVAAAPYALASYNVTGGAVAASSANVAGQLTATAANVTSALDVQGTLRVGDGGFTFSAIREQTFSWDPPPTPSGAQTASPNFLPLNAIVIGVRIPAPPASCQGGFGCSYSYTTFAGGAGATAVTVVNLVFLNGTPGTLDPPGTQWSVIYMLQ